MQRAERRQVIDKLSKILQEVLDIYMMHPEHWRDKKPPHWIDKEEMKSIIIGRLNEKM